MKIDLRLEEKYSPYLQCALKLYLLKKMIILALNANPIEDLAKYDCIAYFIVAYDDKNTMLRTIKLMTAVTLRWLEDCYKACSFHH